MEDILYNILEDLGKIPLTITYDVLADYLTDDDINELIEEDLYILDYAYCTVKKDFYNRPYFAITEVEELL